MGRKRERKNTQRRDNVHVMNLQKEYLLRNFTFSFHLLLLRYWLYVEIMSMKYYIENPKNFQSLILLASRSMQRSKQILYNRSSLMRNLFLTFSLFPSTI